MSDFGQRLKTIRIKRNITQKVLAQSLNMAQSSIASYENNARFPGEVQLKMISEYLNVSVDYLLGLSELEESEAPVKEREDTLNTSPIDYQHICETIFKLLLEGNESMATQTVLSVYQKTTDPLTIIEKIYIPILRETGQRWEADNLSIVQEHFISNLIDRWLIMTSAPVVHHQKKLAALFVVPSAEDHTLILKMIREYFKIAGWVTYFIGSSVPISSLRAYVLEYRVDLIVTSITLKANINSAEHMIQSIRGTKHGKAVKILVGGRGVTNEEEAKTFLGADYYLPKVEDLKETINLIEQDLSQI